VGESEVIYEPRAFWSVGFVDTSVTPSSGKEETTVRLSREHFRNGSRFPVVLTRVAVGAINYTLAQYDVSPVSSSDRYHNDTSIIDVCDISFGVPNRRWWNRKPIQLASLTARATHEPSMRVSDVPYTYASGPWGIYRLAFEHPLQIPESAAIEVGIGSWTTALGIADSPPPALSAWISVEETGGIWPGAARSAQKAILHYTPPSIGPFKPDGFSASPNVPPGRTVPIDIQQTFTATEYTKQDPLRGRAGTRTVHAINVHINQIAFDDAVQSSLVTGVPGSPITPMGLRIPCQARCRGGGSGEWWWRPNAPLALVFNEITPARVYDLPSPVTLEDGDCLDVVIRTPPQWGGLAPRYQIGVAFTGYAVIKG
jgi:hypothetical protein